MKKRIISFLLAATVALSGMSVFAEFASIAEDTYGEINQTFTPIDIKGVANMDFADDVAGDGKGGWTDQGAINDMRYFDQFGKVNFKGVDFDIIDPAKNGGKAVITLRGQNLQTLPNRVEIPINAKGAGVYILHAAAWVVTNVATYSFVYEDGSQYDVPIRNEQEIFNFWGSGNAEKCKTVWSGRNDSTSNVSLFMFAMENPYPSKTISKLVCQTTGSDAFCMIAGVTLTDKGPYMMEDKDIGNVDTSDWYAYEAPTFDTIVGTVLDCSFLLDGPAGKHGWLQSKDGELYFEDGTKANFWGCDVGENVLVSHERIDKIVDRIAALGFNLVRVHNTMAPHLNTRGIFADGKGGHELDPQRVDSLCYTISKLKEKGIHIYLDMYTAPLNNDLYNIRGIKDPTSTGTIKPIFYFDEELQKVEENYIRELLGTYNPYTGCKIAEEKAIAFIDFKNETTLFNFSKDDAKHYDEDLRKLYNEWLKEKYGTDEKLREAWNYLGTDGLKDGESMTDSTVAVGYSGTRESYVKPRFEDSLHFMADIMSDNYKDLDALVLELGYKGLTTACTVWGVNFPALVYTLTDGDMIDSHVYWSHPTANYSMQKGTASGFNGPISMMEDSDFGYMGYLSSENVYGMPHTITEWDECDLNPTMAEEYTLMGAFSSYQNWQPLNFGFYSQFDEVTGIKYNSDETLGGGSRNTINNENYHGDPNAIRDYWSINNNPVKMGCIPAGSIMKLRGDVKEAGAAFYRRYSQNDYFNKDDQAFSRDPYLCVSGKTGVAYDKFKYDESYNSNDVLYRAYMSKKDGIPYVSDTGEMRTDLKNAIFELNTERSQAVTGRISGKRIETDDMIVEITNPFANINLTSLSDEPIWNADKLLITAAGDQRNTDELRSNDGTTIIRGGTAPILVEPIKGKLTIKTPDEITVYRIGSTGARLGTKRVEKDENGYSVIYLSADDACMNYEVVRGEKAKTRSANEHIVYEQVEVKPLFDDLEDCEWAEKQITRNVLWGNMQGVSETEFAPNANITKGDFVAAIVSACKLKTAVKDNFADVPESDGNYDAIAMAKAYGVVCGDENGNFNPNSPISRQDAMTILDRAIAAGNVQCKDTAGDELAKFKDGSEVLDYAKSSTQKMLAQGYIKKLFNSESLEPDKSLTRAEAACIVYGVLWE